ncbi:MAG: lanthionine synthetase C family protein [Candidatus Krumholzibacteriia bacterium]
MSSTAVSKSWRPILEGALARRALLRVEEIAAAIQADHPPSCLDPSLATGSAGLAVLYAYLAEAFAADTFERLARAYWQSSIDALAGMPTTPSLYSGFTGIAWVTAHLDGRLLETGGADLHEEVEEALLAHLRQSPWPHHYDLVDGLTGYGVYALERLPHPRAERCLEQVVLQLERLSRRSADGVAWFTEPALMLPDHRVLYPDGCYDLGLAHGIPGVIALLGMSSARGIGPRALLEDAVRWLLAHRVVSASDGGFGSWLTAGGEPIGHRLGWCYGDPGVAAALLVASRAAGIGPQTGLEIAVHAAALAPERAGVAGSGLCHGTAGLAHLFNRMHHATGERCLAEAARFWFERTLDPRHACPRIAGDRTGSRLDAADRVRGHDPGLLEGAAGIALALLAAATDLPPEWDRFLMLSDRASPDFSDGCAPQ